MSNTFKEKYLVFYPVIQSSVKTITFFLHLNYQLLYLGIGMANQLGHISLLQHPGRQRFPWKIIIRNQN